MFFGRTLTRDEIERLRAEREAADRAYNEGLTALDLALPRLPDLPHPPLGYDEYQVTPLNERWHILADPPVDRMSGWRRRLGMFVWHLVSPVLQRQQEFNAALVDHVNRNVAVHRSTREAVKSSLAALRGEIETLESFGSKLIQYLQTITLYVDTKDRSETLALIVQGLSGGLDGVTDEFLKRWEAMVAREQRYVAAVDELRTGIAGVQQMGLTLKRELERMLSASPGAPAPNSVAAPADGTKAPAGPPPTTTSGALDAYKYVGFENKFRGSEADIRARLEGYLPLFEGASEVLDLGCGRGEFLALLRDRGIGARGLDLNHEMVETCRAAGLEVAEGDALGYLESLADGSLGGLFAAQVVEHFAPPYLVRFLDVAFHKLRPGSRIVLETLNPACWFAFFESYLRDITHAWPLHPETLKYLVTASGFQRIDLRFLSPYPREAKLQHCAAPQELSPAMGLAPLFEAFNENVDKINALLFTNLDYAVIGERIAEKQA